MGRRGKTEFNATKLRSAITNGKFVLADVDHRSAWMRRLKDLIAAHTSDLGGESLITHSEAILIRRASMLTLQLEMMEQRWATANEGEASLKEIEVYQRVSNSLHRLLAGLGLQRRSKKIVPSVSEYLELTKARHRNGGDDEEEAAP